MLWMCGHRWPGPISLLSPFTGRYRTRPVGPQGRRRAPRRSGRPTAVSPAHLYRQHTQVGRPPAPRHRQRRQGVSMGCAAPVAPGPWVAQAAPLLPASRRARSVRHPAIRRSILWRLFCLPVLPQSSALPCPPALPRSRAQGRRIGSRPPAALGTTTVGLTRPRRPSPTWPEQWRLPVCSPVDRSPTACRSS